MTRSGGAVEGRRAVAGLEWTVAQFVRIASVLFETQVQAVDRWGTPQARDIVLKETSEALRNLEGLGMDLVALSEGVGAVGQSVGDAEDPGDPGPLLSIYRDFAASQKCHVAGAAKTRRDGEVFNSIVFFGPRGEVLGVYDKTNLTAGEIERGLTSGKGAVVVETEIGLIGGIICFDLNFESLRVQYRRLRPDILVFASLFHGGLQQQTWAYDCRAYFVCAWQFHGGGILDPFGRAVARTHSYANVATARINLDRVMVHLDYNREKFADIRRKYGDEVIIDVPPDVGSCLILSATDKRSALDVAREFELELLDDYFARAVEANDRNRRRTPKGPTARRRPGGADA